MNDLDAHIARVVDTAPPLTGEQVDRLTALLHAEKAATHRGDLLTIEPGTARTVTQCNPAGDSETAA